MAAPRRSGKPTCKDLFILFFIVLRSKTYSYIKD